MKRKTDLNKNLARQQKKTNTKKNPASNAEQGEPPGKPPVIDEEGKVTKGRLQGVLNHKIPSCTT